MSVFVGTSKKKVVGTIENNSVWSTTVVFELDEYLNQYSIVWSVYCGKEG